MQFWRNGQRATYCVAIMLALAWALFQHGVTAQESGFGAPRQLKFKTNCVGVTSTTQCCVDTDAAPPSLCCGDGAACQLVTAAPQATETLEATRAAGRFATNASSTSTAVEICDGGGADCTGRPRHRLYVLAGNPVTEYLNASNTLVSSQWTIQANSDMGFARSGQANMARFRHDAQIADFLTITSNVTGSVDVADAEFLRLANNEKIAWEASPAGTDQTLTVNASEQLVYNSAVLWGSSTVTKSVYIAAGAMSVSGTCTDTAPVERTIIANGPKLYTIRPADDDTCSIEFDLVMPDSWNGGTVTIALAAMSTGNNLNEVFEMDFSGRCVRGNTDSVAAHSTTGEQAATITWPSGTSREEIRTTAAITLNGTCTAVPSGEVMHVYFRGQTDATATTTSPISDVEILGVRLEYAISTNTD